MSTSADTVMHVGGYHDSCGGYHEYMGGGGGGCSVHQVFNINQRLLSVCSLT